MLPPSPHAQPLPRRLPCPRAFHLQRCPSSHQTQQPVSLGAPPDGERITAEVADSLAEQRTPRAGVVAIIRPDSSLEPAAHRHHPLVLHSLRHQSVPALMLPLLHPHVQCLLVPAHTATTHDSC